MFPAIFSNSPQGRIPIPIALLSICCLFAAGFIVNPNEKANWAFSATEPQKTTKLPSTPPAQMYMQYRAVLLRPDSKFIDMLPYLSKESRKSTPGLEDAERALPMIRALSPKEVSVTKTEINGNKAKLYLTSSSPMANPFGDKSSKYQTKGTATFSIEDGQWKLDKESWRTKQAKETGAPDQAWCWQASSCEFPRKSAGGRIHGEAFQVDAAKIQGSRLLLNEGTDFFPVRCVEIFFQDKVSNLEGQTLSMEEESDIKAPQATMSWKAAEEKLPTSKHYFADDGVGMRLRFMKKNKEGRIPLWIVIRFPDKDRSYVEGYAEATIAE